MYTLSIFELADYILSSYADKQITPMKLQKLAYYVKVWTLVAGFPVTDAPFQRWAYGPVNEELYHTYKTYGNRVINKEVVKPSLPDDEQLINFILENYADYSAFELSAMTHNEEPWQETANGKTIPDQLIKSYYSQDPFARNFVKFDPENNPFYMLQDDAWHAFTMDMSPEDVEQSGTAPSYAQYQQYKKEATDAFNEFWNQLSG